MENINGLNQLEEFILDCLENKNVCVVYFGAEWCGPCKKLKEKLHDEDIRNKMDKLKVAHVDVDNESNSEIVNKYKITALPTQLFITLEKSETSDNYKVKIFNTIKGYNFDDFEKSYVSYVNNFIQE
jgi:thiol-disulfide isomerase/thioredoxin